MVRNWVSFRLSPPILLRFFKMILLKLVFVPLLYSRSAIDVVKSRHICTIVARPLPLRLSFLFLQSHSSHVSQLSLLSVCVRRKDSLSHKGELLLSTSNLDTHPLLFLADSHRPCQKSTHYCCHCCMLLGSVSKCENYVYRISLCVFVGGSVLIFLQKFLTIH